MVANTLELNGWDSYFLGANTPTEDLLLTIEDKKPDLVVISLSIYFGLPRLKVLIRNIHSRMPEQKIVVGGQAFRNCEDVTELGLFPSILIRDLPTFESYLQNF